MNSYGNIQFETTMLTMRVIFHNSRPIDIAIYFWRQMSLAILQMHTKHVFIIYDIVHRKSWAVDYDFSTSMQTRIRFAQFPLKW